MNGAAGQTLETLEEENELLLLQLHQVQAEVPPFNEGNVCETK